MTSCFKNGSHFGGQMACYWAKSMKEKIELVYALPLHTYALSVPRQSRTELLWYLYGSDLADLLSGLEWRSLLLI